MNDTDRRFLKATIQILEEPIDGLEVFEQSLQCRCDNLWQNFPKKSETLNEESALVFEATQSLKTAVREFKALAGCVA